jgi:hypothetical protein
MATPLSPKLSKKEIIKEVVRCGRDPAYFTESYAKISEPSRGLIPFDLFPFQREVLGEMKDNRFTVILKARQLGISTTSAAYIVWLMLFHREKNVLVIATKMAVATNLVKKAKSIYKHLPNWLKIATITIDNRGSFELSNGSQVKASSTSSDAGRSEALSLLVIDEAAHIAEMTEIWTSIYSTLSTGGSCIALSSPNGVGNWFHKTYTEAEEGKNNFHPIKLMWDLHPDRDQEWFENETANMSRRDVAQELECSFNASGDTVIGGTDLLTIQNSTSEPLHRVGFDRNYWIWEPPVDGADYLAVADVSRGDGSDYSVVHILKVATMEQVAEYQGKLTADMFAPILVGMACEYNNALLVIENNKDYGVLSRIEELEYNNIYYSIKSTHEYVDQAGATAMGGVAGFTMSQKTRPLVIAKMEEFARNKLLKVNSIRTAGELKTFIWHNGRPQAMRSYNDDLVIALAIGCWVRDTAFTANQRELNYKKAMIGGISVSKRGMNTKIPGMIGYENNNKPQTTMVGTDGRTHDISWIYKG